MITVYIWNPGEFRISPTNFSSPSSDFAADWKRALGHASLYVSTTNQYLSLWPNEAPATDNEIRQFTVEAINLLKTVGGVEGIFKRSLNDDIEGMKRPYDQAYAITLVNEQAVSNVVEEYTKGGDVYQHYNLITNNCSTVVFNALHIGATNIDRNRRKDMEAFGLRAWKLFKNAAIFVKTEEFQGLNLMHSQGFTPIDMALSLGELMTLRTPSSVVEYIRGMGIYQD